MQRHPRTLARTPGRAAVALAAVTLAALMAGCSSYQPPQAWEKGDLARPAMALGGDPLAQRFDEHTYTSKEAASGGSGVGGGGCGCN